MNCRRVEKIIPLYVEGDLASGKADRITAHLEWCGRCNWLADEYKESQGWLHSCEPPEFDEAALTDLKVGVLKRIEETAAPSMLTSLIQQWSRRQVFALSTAALIVFGMVVIYVYQTRAALRVPTPEVVESKPSGEPSRRDEPMLAGGPDKSPVAGLRKRHHRSGRHSTVKTSYVDSMIAERAPEPVDSQDGTAPEPRAVLSNNTSTGTGNPPAPLRIEIQTSDPNIRIIWFAPRETDPHQTKPATD